MTFKLGLGCFLAATLLWRVGAGAHDLRLLAGGLLLCAYCLVETAVKTHERKRAERRGLTAPDEG